MDEIKTQYLLPSQLFVSDENYLVTTVLGSCVSVCLWDNVNKIGGINHFMLSFWNGKGLASPKFGNIAMEKLISNMLQKGSNLRNLKAKVFGGAAINIEASDDHVGTKNVKLALKTLEQYNIPVIAKSVGGLNGRKILFCTQTGVVKQKIIQKYECNV